MNRYRDIQSILCFLLLCFGLESQNKFDIRGYVRDKNGNESLPYATVALLNSSRQMISGTTTNEDGSFQLSTRTTDTFYIKVQYIGFEPLDTMISNAGGKSVFQILLLLAPQLNEIKEILINGEKSTLGFRMDKQSFDAQRLGNVQGGTGLDVLQRLPSVTINTEGKILMRGNAEFLVTVNGKFTNQEPADILAQLPANTIERIEIISTPSASQDAEGKAGIINIVTKIEIPGGWGMATSANLSGRSRYGSDLTIYHSNSKFNSFLTANYRQYDIGGYRKGEIRTLYQDTVTYSPSAGERPTFEKIYGIRGGTNYKINPSSSLNTALYYGYRQNDRIAQLNYRQYSSATTPLDLYQLFGSNTLERSFYNENLFVRTGRFFTTNTDFTKIFKNQHKLVLAAIYENSVLGGPLRNFDSDEQHGTIILQERADETSPLNAWRIQADYTHKLSDQMSLETGYQWRTVNHTGIFNFERLDLGNGIWVPDLEFKDDLNLRQTIHGAYIQFNCSFRSLQIRAGLRGEQMFRNLTHTRGSEPLGLDQFDLFPSLQSLVQLKNDQELKWGYSKRIDRPTTKALSPFKNHRHSEAIWIGDPNLLPETSHNFEMTYVKRMEKSSISLTAYHQRTSNLIFRVNDSYNRITLYTISTNAGNSRSTGLEMINEWQVNAWSNFYLTGNTYYFQINQAENALTSITRSLNYNVNTNFTFRLHPKWKLQWNTTYVSRTVTAQGYDTDILLSNLGLKFSANKNWTIDVLAQNLFDDNRQTITTHSSLFYSSTEYTKNDRIIQLSIGYRFNEKGKRSKNIKTEYGEKDF